MVLRTGLSLEPVAGARGAVVGPYTAVVVTVVVATAVMAGKEFSEVARSPCDEVKSYAAW